MTLANLEAFDAPRAYALTCAAYSVSSEELWPDAAELAISGAQLQPGMRVLDVACGSGALTLRAAAIVEIDGGVTAVDAVPEMLAITQERAAAKSLANIRLVNGDLNHLDRIQPRLRRDFDVALCGLAIHCAADRVAFLKSLATYVRPGGRVAFSTYSKSYFMPHSATFLEAVRAVRPSVETWVPFDDTNDRDLMTTTAKRAGLVEVEATTQRVDVPIYGVEEYITKVICATTGYHEIWEQLDGAEQAEVRRRMIDQFAQLDLRRPILGIHHIVGRTCAHRADVAQ